jgi:hypothetical protein
MKKKIHYGLQLLFLWLIFHQAADAQRYFGYVTSINQQTHPIVEEVTEYSSGYYVRYKSYYNYNSPNTWIGRNFSPISAVLSKFGLNTAKYLNGVWVSWYGAYYGANFKFGINVYDPWRNFDPEKGLLNFNTDYQRDFPSPSHNDNVRSCNEPCPGGNFLNPPPFENIQGNNLILTTWGRIYNPLTGQNEFKHSAQPKASFNSTVCRASKCPGPDESAFFYMDFWVGKATPQFTWKWYTPDVKEGIPSDGAGFWVGEDFAKRIANKYIRIPSGGQQVDVGKWMSYNGIYVKAGACPKAFYVREQGVPEFTPWVRYQATNYSPSDPSCNISFGNKKYDVMPTITIGGVEYLMDWFIVEATDCQNCFQSAPSSNSIRQYYCLENNIKDYQKINFKYDCSKGGYKIQGVRQGASSAEDNIKIPLLNNVEELTPVCAPQGALYNNNCNGILRFPAMKYLMPKANGQSNQKDYIILPNGLNNDKVIEFRSNVNIIPGNTSGPVTEYQIFAKPFFGSTWTLVHSENLNASMARAPGTPSNLPTPGSDNHEFFSSIPPIAGTFGCSNWVSTSTTNYAGGWNEKASWGSLTNVPCRTFIKVLKEDANIANPRIARVRVCIPCAFNAFVTLPDVNIEASLNASLIPIQDAVKTIDLSGSALKISITGLSLNTAFTNCRNDAIATAELLSNLPQSCRDDTHSSKSTNGSKIGNSYTSITAAALNTSMPTNEAKAVPNPFRNTLQLVIVPTETGLGQYRVSDMYGKVLLNKSNQFFVKGIPITDRLTTGQWATGNYLLTITYQNGKQTTVKLVKK